MTEQLAAALYAAQVKARRAQAGADFLEARVDLFEGLGERHDDAKLALSYTSANETGL